MTHPIRGRSALLCLALAGSTALAQNTQAPELEEVIVTGSNIVSSLDAEKRGAPVEVITADAIAKTGANSLADVLAQNPSITGGAQGEQDSGGRGFVNLRGLGTQYTLGVENAFDRDVPFVVYRNDYNSFENDLRGRYIYARLNLDF